jgi:hypothetical protein
MQSPADALYVRQLTWNGLSKVTRTERGHHKADSRQQAADSRQQTALYTRTERANNHQHRHWKQQKCFSCSDDGEDGGGVTGGHP